MHNRSSRVFTPRQESNIEINKCIRVVYFKQTIDSAWVVVIDDGVKKTQNDFENRLCKSWFIFCIVQDAVRLLLRALKYNTFS